MKSSAPKFRSLCNRPFAGIGRAGHGDMQMHDLGIFDPAPLWIPGGGPAFHETEKPATCEDDGRKLVRFLLFDNGILKPQMRRLVAVISPTH